MKLEEFFKKYNKVALGFSGGVDSSYLLYAAHRYGADVKAYYVSTAFQPDFEFKDAMEVANFVSADVEVIKLDILSDKQVISNTEQRCYYCKHRIFTAIMQAALKDGYNTVIDGTNASDIREDRPGMLALEQMQVLSPLRQCSLTKQDVRKLSKQAGLFTWNKPSYSCLATRISSGCTITKEDLQKIEHGEKMLMDMGFSDFRIRLEHGYGKLQVKSEQMQMVLDKSDDIIKALGDDFKDVLLDLKSR